MVFPSIPVYLDPPNWPPQQPTQEQVGGGGVVASNETSQLPLPPPAPAPPGGPAGSAKPNSMTERARMAKIPMPEPGLKCPRCESTSTKFCYFNNYSLTQPRHFCKTCRRYWTRGGALRNVPVGGGCRRNKRSKSSSNRSKSPAVTGQASGSTASGGCGGISSSTTCSAASADVILGHILPPPGPSQLLPFLPPLHNINDYVPSNIGLSFETSRKIGGIDMEFQVGNTTTGGESVLPNGLAEQQWRLQQFSFLGNNNLHASAQVGFYPLRGDQGASDDHQILSASKSSNPAQIVQMEELNRGLDLSRNFSDISGTGQYWQGSGTGTGNAWGSDISHGFSSSASHLL